jgi:hypothetical protein
MPDEPPFESDSPIVSGRSLPMMVCRMQSGWVELHSRTLAQLQGGRRDSAAVWSAHSTLGTHLSDRVAHLSHPSMFGHRTCFLTALTRQSLQ